MKIGWLRITMSVELDFNTAKSGAGQERGPIIRNFIKRGHNVTVYSPMSKRDEKIRDEAISTGASNGPWDNSFLADVNYAPSDLPEDCDVLIVESGALNFGFWDNYNNMPQIRRMCEVINAHKGLVIFNQTDPDLLFPFNKLTECVYDWDHEENAYRLEKGTIAESPDLEDHGWSSRDEIFKDKTCIFLIRTQQYDKATEKFDTSRTKLAHFVEEGLLELRFIPTCHSSEYVNSFEVISNTEYDLFCSGYPRAREKTFENLFLKYVKYFSLASCGPWDKSSNIDYRDMCVENGMTNLGFIDGYNNVYNEINNSLAIVHLGVSRTRKLGWLTGRYLEAVFCKSLVFYDDSCLDYDNYIDHRFGVNEDNAYDKYKWLSKISQEEYEKLWAFQYDKIKYMTIAFYVDELLAICGSYGLKVKKIDKDLVDKYAEVYDEGAVEHDIIYTEEEIDEIFAKIGIKGSVSEKSKKLATKIRRKIKRRLLKKAQADALATEKLKTEDVEMETIPEVEPEESIEVQDSDTALLDKGKEIFNEVVAVSKDSSIRRVVLDILKKVVDVCEMIVTNNDQKE